MADSLVQHMCMGCGQTDDHPKHMFGVIGRNTPPGPWHMDCHVLLGGCEECAEQLGKCGTSTANDGVIGRELQKRLISGRASENSQEG